MTKKKTTTKRQLTNGFFEGKKCIWTAGFVCINWRYNINSSNAYKAVQLEQFSNVDIMQHACLPAKQILLIHQLQLIQCWTLSKKDSNGFLLPRTFWQTKQTSKLCVNHSALCHRQMSTAYKPAFMYIHTLKSAHTKKSWSVVFSVEKLLD
jgi:hypothetical protein